MPTLREYFDTDFKTLTVHTDWLLADDNGRPWGTVRARISQDFKANAKYWSFFIQQGTPDLRSYLTALFSFPATQSCQLAPDDERVITSMGFASHAETFANSDSLTFTGRVHLYIDETIAPEVHTKIQELGAQHRLKVLTYDRSYASTRAGMEKPVAFISHDSRDKDTLVRQLALELSRQMCPVWYDEYSLKVGDSLRESIETGLKEAKRCILILSPHFLRNNGWARAEYDSVFTRELLQDEKVILPIWHGVTKTEVYEYSPRLADKVALDSKVGPDELARRLAAVLRQ